MLNCFHEKFLRLSALAATGVMVLSITACSDNDSASLLPDIEAPTVSGDVAKGIIVNGVVNIHPVVSGSIDTSTVLGSGATDSTGHYDAISLTGYESGPIAVRVSTQSDGSTMSVCDLSNGCGTGVDFGDSFTLDDSDFTLDSIIPSVDDTTASVNVSVLTNVASGVALNALTMDPTADITTAINNANTSVANRFGLTGNVTQLPIVDITNPNAVMTTDSATLQYNLFNAAIVQSVLTDSPTTSLTQSVSRFANQFVTSGGLADTETEGAEGVTLANILRDASMVINSVVTTATNSMVMVDLGGLQSEIDAEAGLAENGSAEPEGGNPVVDDEDEALAIVKEDVGGLRTLLVGLDITNSEAFATQIELAGDTIGGDFDYALEGLSYAAGAIARALETNMDSSVPLAEFFDDATDINVVITEVDSVVTYTVDGIVVVERADGTGVEVDIDLVATDSGTTFEEEVVTTNNDDGSFTEMVDFSVDVNLALEGSATITDSVSVTIESGSAVVGLEGTDLIVDDITETDETTGDTTISFTGDFTTDITGLEFSLSVVIDQLGADDPVSFEGDLELSVSAASSIESEVFSNTYDSMQNFIGFEELFEGEETFALVDLSIAGNFSTTSGLSLVASLAISADGTGVVFECTEMFSGDFSSGMGVFDEVIDCTGETEDSFVAADVALAFLLDITGVAEDAQVTVAATRSGLDGAVVVANVSYGANDYSIEYSTPESETDLESLTITTARGVIISLSETADLATEIEGSITLDGTEYGVVEDREGVVFIVYSDDTFESL